MKQNEKTSAFNIRVPETLKAQLNKQAAENGRSLNMEIVLILKAAQQDAHQRTAA